MSSSLLPNHECRTFPPPLDPSSQTILALASSLDNLSLVRFPSLRQPEGNMSTMCQGNVLGKEGDCPGGNIDVETLSPCYSVTSPACHHFAPDSAYLSEAVWKVYDNENTCKVRLSMGKKGWISYVLLLTCFASPIHLVFSSKCHECSFTACCASVVSPWFCGIWTLLLRSHKWWCSKRNRGPSFFQLHNLSLRNVE